MKKHKITILILAVLTGLFVVIVISGIFGAEHYTAQPEFCGSCHMMKSYYNSWKRSVHGEKDISCNVCHYQPREAQTAYSQFKGLGQLLTYFYSSGRETRMPASVSDQSCLTSKCHTNLKETVQLTEKISLKHSTHRAIIFEGKKLHCSICHHNSTAEKHFEVSGDVCYLCHFQNKNFNEGIAKCSLCHEIPAYPLQRHKRNFKGSWWQENSNDNNVITHQSLEEAKVTCQSCHYEAAKGTGAVNKLKCAACHSGILNPDVQGGEKILEATDHSTGQHVAGQYAECNDCHAPIQHKMDKSLDPIVEGCFDCHPDHHKFQKLLLLGEKRDVDSNIPKLMYDPKANCMSCHLEEKVIDGEKVLLGSAKSCVACHTEKHALMVEEWKNKTKEELKNAKGLEEKAKHAIENAKGNVSGEKLEEAMAMFKKGQENVNIVQYGGGWHNKRYSLKLLDDAMNDFEEATDLLNE